MGVGLGLEDLPSCGKILFLLGLRVLFVCFPFGDEFCNVKKDSRASRSTACELWFEGAVFGMQDFGI